MTSRSRPVRAAIGALSLLPLLVTACMVKPEDDVIGETDPPPPITTGPFLGLTADPPDALPESLGVAFDMARATGVTAMTCTMAWSDVEGAGGTIDWYSPASQLGSFRGQRFAAFLTLCLIDGRMRRTPSDLAARAWDDPVLVERADRMVDSLAWLARENQVIGVALGRDVDRYFETHAAEFPAFLALARRAVERLHARAPGIPVGIGTSRPLGNPLAHFGDSLDTAGDLAVHTLYATAAGGVQAESPAAFEGMLAHLLARRAGRRLVIQEVGCASTASLGGSPAAQAECARRFRAWYAQRTAGELLLANWHRFTDPSASGLRFLGSYLGGLTAEESAFQGGLGLRDSSGTPKEAWSAWRGL